MSDTSQGPGWWQASDGKWYPPESAPWAAPATPPSGTTPPVNPTPAAGEPASFGQSPYGQAPPDPATPYGQAAPYGQPAYGQVPPDPAAPYGQPAYGQTPYGQPGYGQAPYGQAPYGYGQPGYPAAAKTNGMAIGSLVCALLGFICFVGIILAGIGLVLGFSARKKIRESGGAETGDGLALAGIIVGAVFLAFQIGFIVLAIIGGATNNNGTDNGMVRPPAAVVVFTAPN